MNDAKDITFTQVAVTESTRRRIRVLSALLDMSMYKVIEEAIELYIQHKKIDVRAIRKTGIDIAA